MEILQLTSEKLHARKWLVSQAILRAWIVQSKIDDDNYLQVEMGGKTAYLLLKNVQEHFSVEDITHIATGEKLNLLVYNFPYSGKIVSGILKISSDNKTYISYSEGKNLYYIAMSKTPKE